jgi:pimeloyl-ACP methyl ester carboxylesterase
LFAPIYRQRTGAGIADTARNDEWDWSGPYGDVLAAWRWYLGHDNHGRGVVLVGHSQGTLLLQKLIAAEIDGKPVQAQLVSAFLAGDQSLQVPKGARVGGTFKHVPLCAAAAETGCVYVWGSYLAGDDQPVRFFGNDGGNGLVAACVSPAAPAGGAGALKTYLPKPAMAAAADPPWIEAEAQLSAACLADDKGNVLRVSVLPGRFAPLLTTMLQEISARPKWGLHRLDVSFVQGNILDVIAAQSESWSKRHAQAAH